MKNPSHIVVTNLYWIYTNVKTFDKSMDIQQTLREMYLLVPVKVVIIVLNYFLGLKTPITFFSVIRLIIRDRLSRTPLNRRKGCSVTNHNLTLKIERNLHYRELVSGGYYVLTQ